LSPCVSLILALLSDGATAGGGGGLPLRYLVCLILSLTFDVAVRSARLL